MRYCIVSSSVKFNFKVPDLNLSDILCCDRLKAFFSTFHMPHYISQIPNFPISHFIVEDDVMTHIFISIPQQSLISWRIYFALYKWSLECLWHHLSHHLQPLMCMDT